MEGGARHTMTYPQPEDVLVTSIFCLVVALMVATCVAIHSWRRNPFGHCPRLSRSIDVSRRRNVDFRLEVVDWLYDDDHWNEILEHERAVAAWERDCRSLAERSVWSRHRTRQLDAVLDRAHRCYTFRTVRHHRSGRLRYAVTDESRTMSFAQVRRLRQSAVSRGGTTPAFVRRERAKMTPAIRRAVAERDHYTCQMCGKYMPDGVGLQIDHIVPVSKGGRTEMGNLQVLCSKCNARKSNR